MKRAHIDPVDASLSFATPPILLILSILFFSYSRPFAFIRG
jgi:hypothetical protein